MDDNFMKRVLIASAGALILLGSGAVWKVADLTTNIETLKVTAVNTKDELGNLQDQVQRSSAVVGELAKSIYSLNATMALLQETMKGFPSNYCPRYKCDILEERMKNDKP